ncbi:MAG: acetyl-CoA carboxylase biotin carboxyl carrier protein subunit [Ignavibacteriae bacterium]|jgi:biotin carboxyl carrier protein|nr:acetyl-CoA carboxylase biotin carboxyl carrier protein subunit [Ignavibacteriota bacterium]
MKKFKFSINNNSYDVNLLSFESNKVKLEVNGKPYEVLLDKSGDVSKTPTLVRQSPQTSTDSHKATALTSSPSEKKGSGVIKAPLPGTIIKVFVKEGDTVRSGENLLTWEAMKMENNLSSDREGTVKSVKVKPGDNILEGDVLVEIA